MIGIGIGIAADFLKITSQQNSNGGNEIETTTAKKAGLIVRYNAIEALAELFNSYGESISMLVNNIGMASADDINKYKRIVDLGMDLGVWSNLAATNSAFIVNSITPNNQAYYQAQDDLEDDKGIQEFKIYNGYNYCLLNVIYPDNPLTLGNRVSQVNFSTISGGSDISYINPFATQGHAVYLDSTKSYASDFPALALDKWWCTAYVSPGVYKLMMNGVIPLEDYCGGAILGSGDYVSTNSLIVIAFNTFYPSLTGLKYVYQENQRNFLAVGLPAPVSMAEVESGGYPMWNVYGNDWYDVMEKLGYKGATKNPTGRPWVGIYASSPNSRFRIIADSGQVISALGSIQLMKENIAYYIGKNYFSFDRRSGYSPNLGLTEWEELINWLQANDIPIHSYKSFGIDHYEKTYKNDNIFPRLNRDIASRADGTPDGFETIPDGIVLKTSGGNIIDEGYYLEFSNATASVVTIDALGGFSMGDNVISFYAKNDGTAYDVFRITLTSGLTRDYEARIIDIYINSSEWQYYTVNVPVYFTYRKTIIGVSAWNSSGSLDVTGIEIKQREIILSAGMEIETEDLITRMMSSGVEPDSARKTIIDNTVKALKKAEVIDGAYVNLFDKIIALHTHASHSEISAQLNWKKDAYNITLYNSPSYIVDRGWILNGSNQYMSTGFNPASIADEFKEWRLYDACCMIYINVGSDINNNAMDLGCRPTTTGRAGISVNYAPAYGAMGLNSAFGTYNEMAGNVKGCFGIGRFSIENSRIHYLLNDNTIDTKDNAIGTIPDAVFYYGRHSNLYSDKRYAYGLIARGMNGLEMKKFNEIMVEHYLTPLGAT